MMAISGYHDLLHSNLFDQGAGFTPQELSLRGKRICGESWPSLDAKYGDNPDLYSACFTLAYFYALLSDSYRFEDQYYFDTAQDIDWTSGVALYQAYHP